MEKQDEVSYWAVLFRASSFTDLLGRLDAINEIMKYDQGVIDDLKAPSGGDRGEEGHAGERQG